MTSTLWMSVLACGPAPDPWMTGYVQSVVPWVQDSTGRWLLFDTGTPRTQIRTDVAGGEPGIRSVPGWSVGRFAPDTVLVSDDLPEPMLEAESRGDVIGLGGIVGADLLLTSRWWLDPRGSTLWVDQDPPGVRVVTEVAVEPEGAGRSCFADLPCFEYEGARILVDAVVEGERMTLLLDTGATYVMLEPAALERVGVPVHDWDFGDDVLSIGAVEVSVGDADATEVAVLRAPEDFGRLVVDVELEVDRRVDGVLGHTFLRKFVLGLDAPAGTLSLGEYTAGDWTSGLGWVSPGFGVEPDAEDCFSAQFVIAESAPEDAGMAPGDCITSVDGLTPRDASAVDVMNHLHDLGPGVDVVVGWGGDEVRFQNRTWTQ